MTVWQVLKWIHFLTLILFKNVHLKTDALQLPTAKRDPLIVAGVFLEKSRWELCGHWL